MMKKVLYGVAMALLAGASVGTLQSCKDDVSDLKTQTSFSLDQLRSDLKKDISDLEIKMDQKYGGKIDMTVLNQTLEDYAKKTWVLDKLDSLANHLTGTGSSVDSIKGDVKEINGWIETAGQKFNKLDSLSGALANDIVGASQSLNTRIDSIGNSIQNNYVLKSEFNSFKSIVNNRLDSLSVLDARIETNAIAIAALTKTVNTVDSTLNVRINEMGNRVDSVNWRVDAVDVRLNGIDASILGINNSIGGLNTSVAGLQGAVNTINNTLNGLEVRISTVEGDLNITKENVESLKQKVYFLGKDVQSLRNDLNTLSGDVVALSQRVTKIEADLKNLTSRIDDMLSGLLIQATDSPVFGNFSLPLGVKSTLLFNWHGQNKTGIRKFPAKNDEYEYNASADANESAFILDFPAMAEQVSIMDGVIGDVNLGTVYLTLNPVGHYFDNNNFVLETSKGTKLPVTINVSKSNEELYFGYSRDREQIVGNGFYAAEVVITGDEAEREKGVDAARVKIDDNLKTAVKDVLKDRTKRNAVSLLKAIYGQLDGMLPAYGMRYNWSNDGKDYSVLSGYDLAVATARPLSYNNFKDGLTSRRLRKFGHIKNLVSEFRGKFKFDFDPITFDSIKITLPAMNINADSIRIADDKKMVDVIIDPIHVEGSVEGVPDAKVDAYTKKDTVTVNLENIIDDLTSEINKSINKITTDIKGWTAEANASITDDLKKQLDPVAKQINDMLDKINGQIDDMIADVEGKAQPWFDRLNRVVDLYNRFADKVNELLNDPNHYLQVAMFYNQKGSGVGILSNDVKDPTPFVGGNGNVGLYASSYSGEIVCPAFKKYVACTNVFNMDGKTHPVNDGALRMEVNNTAKNFNAVVDGNIVRYAIPSSCLKKNYIYEITYQGLDYSGVTSTQKFYITVK